MAKPRGSERNYHGRLGNRVTYRLIKKEVSRTIGRLSLEEYHQRESFEGSRKQWSEFALASNLSKTVRQALLPYKKSLCGTYLSGQLTGRFRILIAAGEGEEGRRSFKRQQLQILEGLPLNSERPKRAFISMGSPLIVDQEKYRVKLDSSLQDLEYLFGLPLREYHRIVLGLIALSEIPHRKGSYEILHPEWHGKAVFKELRDLPVTKEAAQLEAELGFEEVPEGSAIGVVGILAVL